MHCRITQPVGISTVFLKAMDSTLHSPMAGKLPAIEAIQWDCDLVYSTIKFLQAAEANTDCLLLKQAESFKNTDNGFVAWQPS